MSFSDSKEELLPYMKRVLQGKPLSIGEEAPLGKGKRQPAKRKWLAEIDEHVDDEDSEVSRKSKKVGVHPRNTDPKNGF